MDETIKIIVGTLSGFVIAFLAEPIKLFFQTTAKKNNLRKGLYHEIAHNYSVLANLFEKNDEDDNEVFVADNLENAALLVRTECYKYVISQETYLFYQLKEAATINIIYSTLEMIFSIANYEATKKDFASLVKTIRKLNIEPNVRLFLEAVKRSLDNTTLDKKLMMKTIGKNVYKVIFESHT